METTDTNGQATDVRGRIAVDEALERAGDIRISDGDRAAADRLLGST